METIDLDGSNALIVEFFDNSILYQRGIYPHEDFQLERKYGMQLLVTINDELKDYVDQVMSQIRVWQRESKLSKLIVVIKSKDTGDILERWQFDIESRAQNGGELGYDQEMTKEVKAQIRGIMRQIVASVTVLPQLDPDDTTFTILAHTDHDVEVPTAWGDSDPKLIAGGGEHVRLKPLATSKHTIQPIVAYRITDDDI
ncbi:DNA-binding protein [Fennellomyces sp. T-0311]|nr:DNA-binding protein [Fennellomyces sp. T-0311]